MRASLANSGNQYHAQVFSREDRAQPDRNGRVTGDLQGAAAVDGRPQVAQERHAGRTSLNMAAHLFTGERFHPAIHVFGKIAEQLSAFIGATRVVGL
jgi:hypothetical protein